MKKRCVSVSSVVDCMSLGSCNVYNSHDLGGVSVSGLVSECGQRRHLSWWWHSSRGNMHVFAHEAPWCACYVECMPCVGVLRCLLGRGIRWLLALYSICPLHVNRLGWRAQEMIDSPHQDNEIDKVNNKIQYFLPCMLFHELVCSHSTSLGSWMQGGHCSNKHCSVPSWECTYQLQAPGVPLPLGDHGDFTASFYPVVAMRWANGVGHIAQHQSAL